MCCIKYLQVTRPISAPAKTGFVMDGWRKPAASDAVVVKVAGRASTDLPEKRSISNSFSFSSICPSEVSSSVYAISLSFDLRISNTSSSLLTRRSLSHAYHANPSLHARLPAHQPTHPLTYSCLASSLDEKDCECKRVPSFLAFSFAIAARVLIQ